MIACQEWSRVGVRKRWIESLCLNGLYDFHREYRSDGTSWRAVTDMESGTLIGLLTASLHSYKYPAKAKD